MSNFCGDFGGKNLSRNPPGTRSSRFGPSKGPLHQLNPKSAGAHGSNTAGGKDSDGRRSSISQWGRQQFNSHKDKSGSTCGPSLGGPSADIGQEMVQVSQFRTVIRDLYPHQPNTVSKS